MNSSRRGVARGLPATPVRSVNGVSSPITRAGIAFAATRASRLAERPAVRLATRATSWSRRGDHAGRDRRGSVRSAGGFSGRAGQDRGSVRTLRRRKSQALSVSGHARGPQDSRTHPLAVAIRRRGLVWSAHEEVMAAGRHGALRKTSNRRASRSRSGRSRLRAGRWMASPSRRFSASSIGPSRWTSSLSETCKR